MQWRLVENFADSHFEAELTLQNEGSEPLVPPWSLYFNSSARLAPDSIKPPLKLEHVNGDFYRLVSVSNALTLAPTSEHKLRISGSPWAINVSDAPSGFYLVRLDERGHELLPTSVRSTIGPFPNAAKIHRGGSDQIPIVTAESRFTANARLTKLPLADLPPVIPTPVSALRQSGEVTIDSSTIIEVSPQLMNEAERLAEAFQRSLGVQLAASSAPAYPSAAAIRLKIGDVEVDGIKKLAGNEAYTLTVVPEVGIEIVGTDAAGVFYGVQSLRALVPLEAYTSPGKSASIPAIRIADAPRFGYRGLHLDVARNFQSVAAVKQLLELMAFYKLNRFHFHLTDDEGWRFEVAAFPELTNVGGRRGHRQSEAECLLPSYGSGPDANSPPGGGFYTRDEFIDILRFAHARHILVIPEIDVPGHSRAAVKALATRVGSTRGRGPSIRLTDPNDESKYESVQAWRDNVVDVGREDSYKFLDAVITELAEMYREANVPLEIVHLGGDEVPRGAWEASPVCRNISTPRNDITRGQQLEIHFLKRAAGLVTDHGATPACWDDCIAFTTTDKDWTKRPIAYVWNSVWGWGREDVGYRLANAGFDVVLSNATHLYFDLANEKDPLEPGYYWAGFVDTRAPFEFNPLDIYQVARQNSMGQPLAREQFATSARLTTNGRRHILGIQGQLWGENLRSPESLQYMAFPRTIALAERAWATEPEFARQSGAPARDATLAAAWNEFANALGQRELPRLHHLAGKIAYRLPPPGILLRDGKLLANVAYPGLTIRFTDDDTEPTSESSIYESPPSAGGTLRFRAFDAYGHAGRSTRIAAP